MKMIVFCFVALFACGSLQAAPTNTIDTVFMAESAIYRNWPDNPRYKEVIPAGTKVSLLVEITQKGERPVVRFLYPEGAKIGDKDIRDYNVVAHLAAHGSLDHLPADKPFILHAIIVNGGMVCYNAFFLYLEGTTPLYDATGAPMPNFPEKYKGWK